MFSPAGICRRRASKVESMSPDQTAAPYRWLPAHADQHSETTSVSPWPAKSGVITIRAPGGGGDGSSAPGKSSLTDCRTVPRTRRLSALQGSIRTVAWQPRHSTAAPS